MVSVSGRTSLSSLISLLSHNSFQTQKTFWYWWGESNERDIENITTYSTLKNLQSSIEMLNEKNGLWKAFLRKSSIALMDLQENSNRRTYV